MEKRQPIYLKEALDIINTRKPDNSFAEFDISIRTFNGQSGKGGRYVTYRNVRLLPEANHNKKKESIKTILDDVKQAKRPNHYLNRTRNIEFPDGTVKTIRIDFIIEINSYPIIY